MFLSTQGIRTARKRNAVALDISFNGTMPAEATYVAGANQTHIDVNSVMQSTGVPWDYQSGALQGLLFEEALTNLVLRSEEADNVVHNLTGAIVTPDVTLAPDNAMTADLSQEDTSLDVHEVEAEATVTTATQYTAYAYLKKELRTLAHVRLNTITLAEAVQVQFDLDAGSASPVTGNPDGSGIRFIANDWYLCWVTATTNANGVLAMRWRTAISTGANYQGEGGKGIYIWGMGCVADDKPGSYIKTVASTVTRTAPTLSIAIANDTYNIFVETPNGTFEETSQVVSGGAYSFDWADFTNAGSERHIKRLRFFSTDPGIEPPPTGQAPILKGLGLRGGEGDHSGVRTAAFYDKALNRSRMRYVAPILPMDVVMTGPGPNDFSSAAMDANLVEVRSRGLLYCPAPRAWAFGTPAAQSPGTMYLPGHIKQNPGVYGGLTVGSGGMAIKSNGKYVTRFWDPDVMGEIIRWYQFMFEWAADKPDVPVIFGMETITGDINFASADSSDYRTDVCVEQWKRLITACTLAGGTDTRFSFLCNFIKQRGGTGGNGSTKEGDLGILYDWCVEKGAAWGWIDNNIKQPGAPAGSFARDTQELGGNGSAANPGKSIPVIIYSEQGGASTGAFADLDGLLISDINDATQESVEDMTEISIDGYKCDAVAVIEFVDSKSVFGEQDLNDIIDNPGIQARNDPKFVNWATAVDE